MVWSGEKIGLRGSIDMMGFLVCGARLHHWNCGVSVPKARSCRSSI